MQVYFQLTPAGPVLGILSVADSDTLSSAGLVFTPGALSATEAGDTLSAAGKVRVSGVFAHTEAGDTLSSMGFVGHAIAQLILTEPDDALRANSVLLYAPIRTPVSYTPAPLPIIPGGEGAYAHRELHRVKTSMDSMRALLPQGANEAPKVLLDGMVRFSRAPWWPVAGQSADSWVYYDEPSTSWKYQRLN